MGASNNYGGVIWTHHALERLTQRGLSQSLAWETFRYPDSSYAGKKSGTTEYIKQVGKSKITIVATQNEKKEWIILSCWVDPPLPGSIDLTTKQDYQKYQRASFWGKLFMTFKRQTGF